MFVFVNIFVGWTKFSRKKLNENLYTLLMKGFFVFEFQKNLIFVKIKVESNISKKLDGNIGYISCHWTHKINKTCHFLNNHFLFFIFCSYVSFVKELEIKVVNSVSMLIL